ncbi:ARM repeat-containing protein [Coprinellus micaceus]|uniref:ARM repeat-containing protein n=1 Tax=Coprinellus micaceus TaxID=71717 RepID=A0A4Y7TPN7_COPMI|nr:ARM repeat-containing protein [Coprinellus micaceus]
MGPTTELLHTFRNTQDRVWTIQELKGHIGEFSSDQYGSRFVQDAIREGDVASIDIIYDEIVDAGVLKISKDVFGNYVIQRILEHGADAHKDGALKLLKGHMRELSLHIYGCRVVQKLLDVATSAQQAEIVKELEPHVPECVHSAHGNHVVQKILEVVPPTYLNFVSVFRGRVINIARHTYGCRVIQRCFQHLPPQQAQPLLTEFMEYAFDMITDQFGNYVIQYLLESGRPSERNYIVSLMRGNIVPFSLHKHASNVCERAFIYTPEKIRQDLIDELLVLDHNHFPRGIHALVHDQYGNYVLQRAVEQAHGLQKDYLMSVISQQLRNVRVGPIGDQCVKYLAVDRALRRHGVDARRCAPAPIVRIHEHRYLPLVAY